MHLLNTNDKKSVVNKMPEKVTRKRKNVNEAILKVPIKENNENSNVLNAFRADSV